MKQGIIIFLYFWALAGIAQFTSISATMVIGIITLPLIVEILVNMDIKNR